MEAHFSIVSRGLILRKYDLKVQILMKDAERRAISKLNLLNEPLLLFSDRPDITLRNYVYFKTTVDEIATETIHCRSRKDAEAMKQELHDKLQKLQPLIDKELPAIQKERDDRVTHLRENKEERELTERVLGADYVKKLLNE